MICPSCGYLLQKLSVTTNSGGKFDIDHCGRCGGTWFNPYEINRIPYPEVVNLAKLTVLPKHQLHTTNTHLCPRCRIELSNYHGESIPARVTILRCNKCHGVWATQKALEAFKDKQEDTIKEYKMSKVAFPALSVVFVPALFVALLFFATFVTTLTLQESQERRIQATQMMTNLLVKPISPSIVSVTFQTKSPVISTISYGKSSLEMKEKYISETLSTNHQLLLTDLEPNTVYLYKITLRDGQGHKFTTALQSFITQK